MKKLRVLFLPPLPHQKYPWESDVIEAVSPNHELSLCDYDKPFAPQFANIDAVIDFGGEQARSDPIAVHDLCRQCLPRSGDGLRCHEHSQRAQQQE